MRELVPLDVAEMESVTITSLRAEVERLSQLYQDLQFQLFMHTGKSQCDIPSDKQRNNVDVACSPMDVSGGSQRGEGVDHSSVALDASAGIAVCTQHSNSASSLSLLISRADTITSENNAPRAVASNSMVDSVSEKDAEIAMIVAERNSLQQRVDTHARSMELLMSEKLAAAEAYERRLSVAKAELAELQQIVVDSRTASTTAEAFVAMEIDAPQPPSSEQLQLKSHTHVHVPTLPTNAVVDRCVSPIPLCSVHVSDAATMTDERVAIDMGTSPECVRVASVATVTTVVGLQSVSTATDWSTHLRHVSSGTEPIGTSDASVATVATMAIEVEEHVQPTSMDACTHVGEPRSPSAPCLTPLVRAASHVHGGKHSECCVDRQTADDVFIETNLPNAVGSVLSVAHPGVMHSADCDVARDTASGNAPNASEAVEGIRDVTMGTVARDEDDMTQPPACVALAESISFNNNDSVGGQLASRGGESASFPARQSCSVSTSTHTQPRGGLEVETFAAESAHTQPPASINDHHLFGLSCGATCNDAEQEDMVDSFVGTGAADEAVAPAMDCSGIPCRYPGMEDTHTHEQTHSDPARSEDDAMMAYSFHANHLIGDCDTHSEVSISDYAPTKGQVPPETPTRADERFSVDLVTPSSNMHTPVVNRRASYGGGDFMTSPYQPVANNNNSINQDKTNSHIINNNNTDNASTNINTNTKKRKAADDTPRSTRQKLSDGTNASPSEKRHRPKGGSVVVSFSGFKDGHVSHDIAFRTRLSTMVESNLGGTVRYESEFDHRISHVVVPSGCRTLKTLAAALTQRWIMSPEWIIDSVEAGKFLPEDAYGARYTATPFKGKLFILGQSFLRENAEKSHKIENARTLIEVLGKGRIISSESTLADGADYELVAESVTPRQPRQIVWSQVLDMIPGADSSVKSPFSAKQERTSSHPHSLVSCGVTMTTDNGHVADICKEDALISVPIVVDAVAVAGRQASQDAFTTPAIRRAESASG